MLSLASRRTLLALLLSPAILPVAVVVFAVHEGLRLGESVAVAAVYAAFTYSGTVVVGVPAHVMLVRWGLTSIWHYAVAGVLGGILILAAFLLVSHNTPLSVISVIIFAGFGAVTATVFWKLSRPGAA